MSFNVDAYFAMTCGPETWSFTKKQRERLEVAQRTMERSMFGITRKDKKRNEWIREKTGVDDIVNNRCNETVLGVPWENGK